VVYILDQVRALEAEMLKRIQQAGLEGLEPSIVILTRLLPDSIACCRHVEKVYGCKHTDILRVPFRNIVKPDGSQHRSASLGLHPADNAGPIPTGTAPRWHSWLGQCYTAR